MARRPHRRSGISKSYSFDSLERRVLLAGQIYLVQRASDETTGSVGEYLPGGGMVNGPLISGLDSPSAIAATPTDLFVSNNNNSQGEVIAEYTTNGALVNPALITGVEGATTIVVQGTDLFCNTNGDYIAEFTTSGTVVNRRLITGLTDVSSFAIDGPDLFVVISNDSTSPNTGRVAEYTVSGRLINANFITGLNGPTDVAISGMDLFITNSYDGAISEYSTGGSLVSSSLIQGTGIGDPEDIAVDGADLLIMDYATFSGGVNGVVEYNTGGVLLNNSIAPVTIGDFAYRIAVAPPTLTNPVEQTVFLQSPGVSIDTGAVPTVVVDVEDANGSVVTDDNSNVTIALMAGSTSSPLGGTTTVAAVDGVATFSDLSITSPLSDLTLVATDVGSSVSGTSSSFATVTSGGGGGGGSGGGGGGNSATGVNPTVSASTVPAEVVGGGTLHATLSVKLSSSESATEKFTSKVYASTDTTLDTTADTLVTSVTKPTTIKAGKSAALKIPIPKLPASLPDGAYYLIVQTTDSSGDTESAAAGSPITVAAPFVTLSETVTSTLPPMLVSGTSAKGTVTATITNHGNVPSKGMTAIDVTASTTSGVLGTSIATLTKNLDILPGKSVKVAVPIKNTPPLQDGSYFLVLQTTDPFAHGTSIASSTTATTISAPFISLSGVLGPVKNIKSGDTLTVTNNGNEEDTSTFTATIGFSSNANGTQPIGQTQTATSKTLHILPGKSIKVSSNQWSKILTGLTPGVPYYLTVSTQDSTGHTVFAVSTTSFTL